MSLFGWPRETRLALNALVQDGLAVEDVRLAEQPGRWVASSLVLQGYWLSRAVRACDLGVFKTG